MLYSICDKCICCDQTCDGCKGLCFTINEHATMLKLYVFFMAIGHLSYRSFIVAAFCIRYYRTLNANHNMLQAHIVKLMRFKSHNCTSHSMQVMLPQLPPRIRRPLIWKVVHPSKFMGCYNKCTINIIIQRMNAIFLTKASRFLYWCLKTW